MNSVSFDHVSKKFRRGQMHDSLRDLLASGLAALRRRDRKQRPDGEFWALDDVSFSAQPGQALGIIGPNGAGKSTALKMLAGILRPDQGAIEVNGRLSALIEINAGLHGDLTGRENIFLSGAIMGMTRREIRNKLDDIVAFSGLERFLDTPVKRYSTGMQARLGFSTAAFVSPDVLLVDEVLSVGDAAFRFRCEQRMSEMVRGGTTLIFVTHNLEQMRKVCDRTLVLNQGRATFLGDPADAIEHYLSATMNSTGAIGYSDQPVDDSATAQVTDVLYSDGCGQSVTSADPGHPLRITVSFRTLEQVPRLGIQVNIRRIGGELFTSIGSQQQEVTFDVEAGDHEVSLTLPSFPVAAGTYYTQIRLWDADQCRLLVETPYRYPLQIDDGGNGTGMLALPHSWSTVSRCKTSEPELLAAG